MLLSSALLVAASVAQGSVWGQGGSEPILGECAGVAIVVDYAELDDTDTVACLTTTASRITARHALTQAGIHIEGTARFPGFVCRVNGKPAADQPLTTDRGTIYERCSVTPSAQAYWSLWTADTKDGWAYATQGVDDITLTHRTAIGLVFHQGPGTVTGPSGDVWGAPATPVDANDDVQETSPDQTRGNQPSYLVLLLGAALVAASAFLVGWKRRAQQRHRD